MHFYQDFCTFRKISNHQCRTWVMLMATMMSQSLKVEENICKNRISSAKSLPRRPSEMKPECKAFLSRQPRTKSTSSVQEGSRSVSWTKKSALRRSGRGKADLTVRGGHVPIHIMPWQQPLFFRTNPLFPLVCSCFLLLDLPTWNT